MTTKSILFFGWEVNNEVIQFLRINYKKKQGDKLKCILTDKNEETINENIENGNKMLNRLNKEYNCNIILNYIKLRQGNDYEIRYFIHIGQHVIITEVNEENHFIIMEKKLDFIKKWIKDWHKIKCQKQFKTPIEPKIINYLFFDSN